MLIFPLISISITWNDWVSFQQILFFPLLMQFWIVFLSLETQSNDNVIIGKKATEIIKEEDDKALRWSSRNKVPVILSICWNNSWKLTYLQGPNLSLTCKCHIRENYRIIYSPKSRFITHLNSLKFYRVCVGVVLLHYAKWGLQLNF